MKNQITTLPSEVQNFLNTNQFNLTTEIGGGGFNMWKYDVYTKGNISIIPNNQADELTYEVWLNYLNDEDLDSDIELNSSWDDVLTYLNK